MVKHLKVLALDIVSMAILLDLSLLDAGPHFTLNLQSKKRVSMILLFNYYSKMLRRIWEKHIIITYFTVYYANF